MFKGLQKNTVGILRIGFLLKTGQEVFMVWWIRASLLESGGLRGLYIVSDDWSVKKSKACIWASLTREVKQMLLMVCVRNLTEKINLFYSTELFWCLARVC